MARRQLVLVLLLGGIAYLWWQSRQPSRYSEWASGLAPDAELAALDRRFEDSAAAIWAFDSPGDSVWRVTALRDDLSRYRVQLVHGDSTLWRLYVELERDGTCRNVWVCTAAKTIHVEPQGDSARFVARGQTVTDAWIPWSADAVLYESVPAICADWTATSASRSLTLIRIQPQTEVVTQLPGALSASEDGSLALSAGGKELVRITYDSGRASRVCLAGGRCLARQARAAS